MEFETIGVVGAGVMGVGMAQNLAQTGHQVILMDNSPEQLEKAPGLIRDNIRMQSFFKKKKEGAESTDTLLGRIQTTQDLGEMARADYVVENVVENWEIKKQVYETMNPICKDECIFGVNTSCVSITKVGSLMRHPENVVGMHFMNPVPLKATVEVIRGFHTTEETIDKAKRFLAQMGKDCIVVNDMPGFVSNRVLMLTVNEAAWVVQDQVATAEDVDALFVKCFSHKMGPLATGDLIGLDTILYSLEVLYESYNEDKFRPCPLLRKMVDAGLLGRKSGRGFHVYNA